MNLVEIVLLKLVMCCTATVCSIFWTLAVAFVCVLLGGWQWDLGETSTLVVWSIIYAIHVVWILGMSADDINRLLRDR